jgi:hypothetical protein
MHGSSPFLKSGWPVGVEPTIDMSHSHARHSDSRHGHSWSTWGYSKTHSADYKSAALPLELQVQSCWSRQQGFNPHPSPYRGDTLALSYAGPNSVVQILPPLLLADSRLAHESSRGVNRYAARLTEQFHACFRRRPICLAPVAVATRGNQVLPRALSASSARNYMLQFQFAAQKLVAAILASVSVADEDVLPRQRLDPQRQAPILAKANDTRQLQADVHIPIVCLFDDGNTLDEQHEGAASPRNVHGLIARIEH